MRAWMREEMEGTGVQIATINPGPFRTGFNDRMYDTLDQWYDPSKHFTQEGPIRDIQTRFSGEELQLDPQGMIDRMVEVIPAEHHRFRTVFPATVCWPFPARSRPCASLRATIAG